MLRSRTLRSNSRLGVVVAALCASALLVPELAAAQEYTAARKVGRGVAGIALGFLEIPGNMVRETRENGALSGMTVGLFRGLGDFVSRELIGVYELLSAPFELPEGFVPILEPEYPWQYFDEASPSAGLAAELREMPGLEVASQGGALVVTLGEDLLFRTGSATLSSDAKTRLAAIAASLSREPGIDVTVRGHTDNTGSDQTNQTLSTGRADAVARELAEGGVERQRLSVQGLGASSPLASNATVEGRRLNRRVEIDLR